MNIETMDKEMLINEMTIKVNEAVNASEAVEAVIEAIEQLISDGNKQLAELDKALVYKQEAIDSITNLTELKSAQVEQNNLYDDVKLAKQVNSNRVKALHTELEQGAEEFFKVHKTALWLYREMDNYMVINTTLLELTTAKEMMVGYSNVMYSSFQSVRGILLETKRVAEAEQNKVWKGTHLGQIESNTQLLDFEYHIKQYIEQLKGKGLQIR